MSVGESVVGWRCKAFQTVACCKNVSLPMQSFENFSFIMNQEGSANTSIAWGKNETDVWKGQENSMPQ